MYKPAPYNNLLFCLFTIATIAFACKPKSEGKSQALNAQQMEQIIENEKQAEEKQKILEAKVRLKAKANEAKQYCIDKRLNTDYCLLIDMSIHSGKNRFFIWDFSKDTIKYSGLCCHGYGMNSTETNPVYSNVVGSYCTSVGKYKTGARAYSNWGIHVHYKLHGLGKTNNNAFKRMVVLHSYSYVPESEIYPDHLPLGYSQGCPVIDNRIMTIIDNILKKDTKPMLLWIYNE